VESLVNSLRLYYSGSGLVVNYNGGGVRINGTFTVFTASTITLANTIASGAIYVDPTTMLITANTTGTFPSNCAPLATYTTSGGNVTALGLVRVYINNNVVFGSSGDIASLTPNLSAAAGSTNRYADAGHIHNVPTASATTISTNANSQGTAATFANSDHKHQITLGSASNDSVPQYDGSNWQATFPEQTIQASRAYSLFDEFVAGVNTGSLGWLVSTAGGGSSITVGAATAASNHPGVFRLTSGANAGSSASLLLAQSNIIIGGGAINMETDINIGTLSNGTQTFQIRFGIGDSGSTDFTNGVYFEYNIATSTNWVIKTAAAGTRTSTTTSTAVATGWTKLTIQINAAGSSAQFFINGTSVGTINTNLPTAASGIAIQVDGILGNATKSVDVDYFSMNQRFTTAR
jgi:hypothetical protein